MTATTTPAATPAAPTQDILVHTEAGVTTLTLNRVDKKNSLTRALEASTTNRILQLTTVPVLVVSGDAMSPLERYGFPAGVGAAITALLMFAAVD